MNALRFWTLGIALGSFLTVTYLVCVLFGLLLPDEVRMYQAWALLLPGFTWIDWGSFILGTVESFLYGLYIAAVFVPIYNYVARREKRDEARGAAEAEIGTDARG